LILYVSITSEHKSKLIKQIMNECHSLILNISMELLYHTELTYLISQSDTMGVSRLLRSEDININKKNKIGEHPLTLACKLDNYFIAIMLLNHPKIDLSIINFEDDDCPWISSARNKNTTLCKSLLLNNNIVNRFEKNINKIVSSLVLSKNIRMLCFCIQRTSNSRELSSSFLFNMVSMDIPEDDMYEIFSKLPIDYNLNITNKQGYSLISLIFLKGYSKILEFLNAKSILLIDYITYSGKIDNSDSSSSYRNINDDKLYLSLISIARTQEQIIFIVKALQEKNYTNADILHMAVKYGNLQITEYIHKNMKFDSDTLSILLHSSLKKMYNFSDNFHELLLKDQLININIVNDSLTPLLITIAKQNRVIFNILINDIRLDINLLNPLYFAINLIDRKNLDVYFIDKILRHPKLNIGLKANGDEAEDYDQNTAVTLFLQKIYYSTVNQRDNLLNSILEIMLQHKSFKFRKHAILKEIFYRQDHKLIKKLLIEYFPLGNIPESIHLTKRMTGMVNYYKTNPIKVHYQMRRKFLEDNPLKHFSLMVLLSDNFLTYNQSCPDWVKKYFDITSKLPMELQMLVTNVNYRLGDIIINKRNIDRIFKKFLE